MYNFKEPWKIKIAAALNKMLEEAGINGSINPNDIMAETPPSPDMGDIGFPMFSFAKIMRKAPAQIAQAVSLILADIKDDNSQGEQAPGERSIPGDLFEALGPYLNVRLDRKREAFAVLQDIKPFCQETNAVNKDIVSFGRPGALSGKKVMVEFSSPNTNKPLHLGHLRNNVLGESVSRILKANGASVKKVCIINDRGIHICKSMLAYKEHGNGKTPETEGVKTDHFVGDWYVRFSQELKKETDDLIAGGIEKEKAEARTQIMSRAQELLRKWEAGDPDTVTLWKQMNSWAVEGMKKTYERTGISFDEFNFESETYLLGRDEVYKGLEKGIFYKQDDGAIAIDLTAEKLDKKILLRADGTSIYITQDFGTAINRHNSWVFDKLIYVVGSEQQYHFKVLFLILDKLGFPWAKNLYHLSYGMVSLPEGKMKSREGTVVDADDLIDSLRDMALSEIREKGREEEVGDPMEVAEKIALGALHYFLLQVSPVKDMLFDPKESLSFTGNTGPYLQYMGARISSMLRKSEINENDMYLSADFSLLVTDPEWDLIKTLSAYYEAVTDASIELDPSVLTSYLYELSKAFSRFYHECPILNAENEELCAARLGLSKAVLKVLQDALYLICVPFLKIM